jgi:hypothetical protein
MTTSKPQAEPPYDGPAGKTQSRFAIYNCRCGNRFALEVFTSIDVSERADLVQTLIDGNLNRGACNSCGAEVAVETKCVLHDPTSRRFILFIPDKERHLELEARAELLRNLAADPSGGLPSYVVGFEVAFGSQGIRDALEGGPPQASSSDLERREQELREAQARLESGRKELEALQGQLLEREAALQQKAAEMAGLEQELERQAQELESRRRQVEEFAHQLEMKQSAFRIEEKVTVGGGRFPVETGPEPHPDAWGPVDEAQDSPNLQEAVEQALPDFDEPEETEEVGDEITVADDDVVEEASIVSEEAIVEEASIVSEEAIVEDKSLAHEPPPQHPAPAVEPEATPPVPAAPRPSRKPGKVDDEVREALAQPARRLARLTGDDVDLFALTGEASLLDAVKKSSVRFRVHMVEDPDGYPWVVLSAAVRPPGREIHLFNWILDYQIRTHRRILGRLGEKCKAHVTLVSSSMERNVTFMARNRIEGNIKSIASDLEQFFLEHAAVQSPAAPDDAAIMPRLLDELRKPFPFHSKYVEQHTSLSGIVRALDEIVEWSSPENVRKLVRIYSFPLEGVASIKRRILTRAVEAGLDLPGELPADAVSMGFADDDTALVSHSLKAFLGTVRDDHDLTDAEVGENWSKLVDAAQRRDVPLDLEVAEVAADYVRALGGDVSFGAEVALLDATDVGELDVEVLLRWLYRPSRRADAAVELLRRGDREVQGQVMDAVRLMGPDDLLRVVPRILADADDEGEGFFMSSLKSGRRELRLASALALGKLALRSAVVPLINALCEHEEPDWKIEAEVLSRLGVAAIRTVEQFLRNPRGCDDRLVFLASALASTRCNKQVKDLADEKDPSVASLARQAVAMKPRVKAEIDGLLTGETDDPLVLFVRVMDSRLSED